MLSDGAARFTKSQAGYEMAEASRQKYSVRDIPTGVWALGFVALLMDVSSEMIHAASGIPGDRARHFDGHGRFH